MDGFQEGYDFARKSSTVQYAIAAGDQYVQSVDAEIDKLIQGMAAFAEINKSKPNKILGGDLAELWHEGTFNICAAAREYADHATAIRSTARGSADIVLDSGAQYGLKWYKSGKDSAKAQAHSAFEEYKSNGGKKTLEEYLEMIQSSDADQALKDPLYAGQIRLIPDGQLEEARAWLRRKVLEETARGDGFERKYQDALDLLADVDGHSIIDNGHGVQSRPLTKEQATELAQLAKENNIDPAEWGLTADSFISLEDILRGSFDAGMTAALVDMVLKIVPEIYKAIEYLITTGQIDAESIKKIGVAAISGAAQGFLIGSITYAVTAACQAGMVKGIAQVATPSFVGALAVFAFDMMGNAISVARGKMTPREAANAFVSETFITACMLVGTNIVGSVWGPIGCLIGSMLGSIIGGFAVNAGSNIVLAFCVESGFTMFGLVEQDYTLPTEVLEKLGTCIPHYKKAEPKKTSFSRPQFKKPAYQRCEFKTVDFIFLRRGVMSVNKIGYV